MRVSLLTLGLFCLTTFTVETQLNAHAPRGPMEPRIESGKLLELRGKIWSGAGQAGTTGFDGFENYWNIAPADQKPNLFMDYYDTWNMRPNWSHELKQELLKFHRQGYYVIPQIGINIFYLWQQYIDGSQDDELDNLVAGLKYLGIPTFLRVGYEFNNFPGDPWLTPYSPEEFIQVWRIFAKKIREADLEAALVWNASLSGSQGIGPFYPGDEWVDWLGFNVFSDIAGGQHSVMLEMAQMGAERDIPLMIGEASPMIVNQVTYDKWDWFEIYFSMIEAQPTIKQMTYINWDWDVQDMVGGNGMFPWGDARLQMPNSVKDQFFNRMDNPAFFFAADEKTTRALFFYDDDQAPNAVENLSRDGDFLTWNGVTDSGDAGLAHYTIYKDGELWDYIIGEQYPVEDLYWGDVANVQVTAMDRAGNESDKSNKLCVTLDSSVELIMDGGFDLPATSVAVDWKWMGSQDGNAKPAPDDILIDSSEQLTGQNSCILSTEPMNDMGNHWQKEIEYAPKDWKIQLFQAFQVIEGERYKISFEAKSEASTTIQLYFMDHHVNADHTHFPAGQDPNFDEEWEFYEIWPVDIGPQAKTYEFEAVAPATETARLSFMHGKAHRTTIWIDSVSVTAGPGGDGDSDGECDDDDDDDDDDNNDSNGDPNENTDAGCNCSMLGSRGSPTLTPIWTRLIF